MRRCALAWASVSFAAVVVACTSTAGLTSPDVVDGGGTGGDASDGIEASIPDASDPDGDRSDGGTVDLYRATVIADAPLGYWKLDETTGITAVDQMGANDGTYQGGLSFGEPSPAPKGAGAVRFGGTNGRVAIGSVLDFAGKTAITLEAWINLDLLDTDFRRIITKRTATGAKGYSIFCQSNESGCSFELGNGSLSTCSMSLPTGQWVHIVGTYDGATMRGYLNGNEVCTEPASGLLGTFDAPLVFGAYSSGGNYLKGALDEVAIYDTALTSARVKAHYQAMTGQ